MRERKGKERKDQPNKKNNRGIKEKKERKKEREREKTKNMTGSKLIKDTKMDEYTFKKIGKKKEKK